MDAENDDEANQKSIMQKFINGILIPLVLILAVTGILLNWRLTNEIEALQGSNLQTETKSATRLIEGYFEAYFSMIETTAALPLVQEALLEISQHGESFLESPYHDEIVEVLVEIQKLSPDAIQSLYLADFSTSQYLRWDGRTPEKGWDITTRPYYALVNEEKKTVLTSVFQNVAGITVASVSTPVFDPENGEIIGSVNIDLGIDSLLEAMNAITVGQTGYVIVLDSSNKIVSARENKSLLKNIEEAGFPEDLVRMVTEDQAGQIEFQYNGISYCGHVDFVDNLSGWCVLGVIPDMEYYQPVTNITMVVVICFVLCILILSVLCTIVVRKLIQPLKKLSDIVRELSEGNLYVDCTMSGEDEIGRLAEGIKSLVDRLQIYMSYVSESYEKLEQLAYTDALTGMGSRMAFHEKMKEYSQEEMLACVLADVNNLKLCNDQYGHSEGDRMIQQAAACICAAFDSIGSCYRIGGDEFCILIPKSEKDEIQRSLEKAKEWIEETNRKNTPPLSIAFGYAIRHGKTESVQEVFNRSDEMMYETKYRMKKESSARRETR